MSQGKNVGIIDLTQGELGTRGSADLRKEEAETAKAILKVSVRENLSFRDGFFINDEVHLRKVIQKIRAFQPDIVICNAVHDRHLDHGKGNKLVNDACFLSGLTKIKTQSESGENQEAWRPKLVLEYIQWNEITPDIVLDISGFLKTKLNAVKAYSSQFYNPNAKEKNTPISSLNFLESVSYRAQNLGRLIGTEAGEGFTSRQLLSINNLDSLTR